LWEILALAIDRQKRKPAFTILVAETLWECWRDRCNAVFGTQLSRKPAFKLVQKSVLVVEALLYRTTNLTKQVKLAVENQVLLALVLHILPAVLSVQLLLYYRMSTTLASLVC
jgi:hypothetical protein